MKHLRLDSGALWEASDEKALAFGNHNFEWRILPWSLGLIQGSLFQASCSPWIASPCSCIFHTQKKTDTFPLWGSPGLLHLDFNHSLPIPFLFWQISHRNSFHPHARNSDLSSTHKSMFSSAYLHIHVFNWPHVYKTGPPPFATCLAFFFPTANCTSRSSLQTCSRSPMPCPSPQHSQSGIGFLQSLPI